MPKEGILEGSPTGEAGVPRKGHTGDKTQLQNPG